MRRLTIQPLIRRITKYFPTLMRRIVHFILVFIVLACLIGVAGIVYIWYGGQHSTTPIAPMPRSTPRVAIHPVTPAINVPEGAAVEQLSTPIAPGQTASIQVKTNPHSICTIKVEYNHVASTVPGLTDTTADILGVVSWNWVVSSNTPLGSWPVTVTCSLNKKTAVVIGTLVVARATN